MAERRPNSAPAATGSPAPPPSGWTVPERHLHVYPVRVYFEYTDAGGIVYYVNYLKFAERARTEMLRLLGKEQDAMLRENGVGFAVRSCHVDYFRPARLDDTLEVHSRTTEVAGASLRVNQKILRKDDLLADITVRLAVMTRDGRPTRLPAEIRDALAPHVVSPEAG